MIQQNLLHSLNQDDIGSKMLTLFKIKYVWDSLIKRKFNINKTHVFNSVMRIALLQLINEY